MEFSLVGAGLVLLLFNPVVLIHTYLWWCSFAGALFCLTLAAVVYESVLTALVRVVPEVVVYLADTRLDALLPLRVAMRIFLLSHELGFRAMAFASSAVMLFKSMTCTVLKRLSARSTLPLISVVSPRPSGIGSDAGLSCRRGSNENLDAGTLAQAILAQVTDSSFRRDVVARRAFSGSVVFAKSDWD